MRGSIANIVRWWLVAASAWVGIDFAFVRDLSPYFSYYGTIGVGRVDDVIGLVMLSGAALAFVGSFVTGESLERVGWSLAGIAWLVHALGFGLYVVVRAAGADLPTSPFELSWWSLTGTPLAYTALGLIMMRAATSYRLRGPG